MSNTSYGNSAAETDTMNEQEFNEWAELVENWNLDARQFAGTCFCCCKRGFLTDEGMCKACDAESSLRVLVAPIAA